MAIAYITSHNTASGVRISMDLNNSDYVIASGVNFGSTDSSAMILKGYGHDVTVQGTLSGAYYGLALGDGTNDYDNRLYVAENGRVSGGTAALLYGAGEISNKGEIAGIQSGVSLIGSGASAA